MARPGRRRPAAPAAPAAATAPVVFRGGRYRPLTDQDCQQIIDSAFQILQQIGMADAPEWLVDLCVEKGAKQRDDGRLTFPRLLVEQALERAAKQVRLPAFDDHHGLEIGGGYVHIGTGGAAVQVLDSDTGGKILALLLAMRARHGTTLVLITHDPSIAAHAEQQVHLFGGRVVQPQG